jgi:uncharacterized membrane protein YccC
MFGTTRQFMEILSTPRFKESVKTALAMVISYGISLQMGWDRPYWAGFAVAFISLSTVGQSLNKGVLRLAGTVAGMVVALTLIGLYAQDRWAFLLALSLWLGLCTYMMSSPRYSYFWHVSGFVTAIIAMDGGADPVNAFSIAMLRAQETSLGVLVYGLVSILLWPNNSRQAFRQATLQLTKLQAQLFGSSLAQMRGENTGEEARDLKQQSLAARLGFQQLLGAAISDSDEVRENQRLWQRFAKQQLELSLTMQRWRDSFRELEGLSLQDLLPELTAFADHAQGSIEQIQALVEGKGPFPRIETPPLQLEENSLGKLTPFQRAAVLLAVQQLRRLTRLTGKVLTTLDTINGTATNITSPASAVRSLPVTLDTERLAGSVQVMVSISLLFLAVIYIPDMPGGSGLLAMCTPIVMALATTPALPVSAMFIPVANSIVFGSILYIFVMPQLSSFAELGTMIFLATFSICYLYSKPQQMLGRAFGLAMFVTLMGVTNEQSYSILSVTTTALMFICIFILLSITAYIPFSPKPQHVYSRLIARYFRSAEFLLSRPTATRVTGTRQRWRRNFHAHEIATLPAKLNGLAGRINPLLLDTTESGQLQGLVDCLHALSLRLQELDKTTQLAQAPVVAKLLGRDLDLWRQRTEALCRQLADGLGSTAAKNVQEELAATLAHMETHIEAAIEENQVHPLNGQERINFYQLLGFYRGISSTLLGTADQAKLIDWSAWHEERFA